MASFVWTNPVDLRTLGRIANPLQNRCFPRIRSSDNEHSEFDIWDSGRILLCGHRTKWLWEESLTKVMIRCKIPYVIIMVQTSANTLFAVIFHGYRACKSGSFSEIELCKLLIKS